MGGIYKKGASELDQCAHRLFDFVSDRRVEWDKTKIRCCACGELLETAYHEEGLYSVRCGKCKTDCTTATLIKAKSRNDAAEIYNRYHRKDACAKRDESRDWCGKEFEGW